MSDLNPGFSDFNTQVLNSQLLSAMDKFIKYSFKFRYLNDLDFSMIKADSTDEADCNVNDYIKTLKDIIMILLLLFIRA